MRIFIDADACPVMDETVTLARMFNFECIFVSDESHIINKFGAVSITVPTGDNSADYVLICMIKRGDILITADRGLAGICEAKGAVILNHSAEIYYTDKLGNIALERNNISNIKRKTQTIQMFEKKRIFRERFKKLLQEKQLELEERQRKEEELLRILKLRILKEKIIERFEEKHTLEERLLKEEKEFIRVKELTYQKKLQRRKERIKKEQERAAQLKQKPVNVIDLFFWNEQKKAKQNKSKKAIY